MFFEFLFVSFSSSLFFIFFLSFVVLFRRLYFFCQKEDKKRKDQVFEKKHPTRKRKPNATFRQRERERESREIKMVTPLVKTNKIKKKPNGFTRYQSDTAKRVSVRLFFECISTSRDVSLCPLIPTGERHGEVFVVLEDKCVCEVEKRDAKA